MFFKESDIVGDCSLYNSVILSGVSNDIKNLFSLFKELDLTGDCLLYNSVTLFNVSNEREPFFLLL